MASQSVAEAPADVAHGSSYRTKSICFFPFMRLPAELRLRIYHLMLPCQDEPSKSLAWSIGPKGCMNLLLSNRKIWNEAREVVYNYSAFTIDISTASTVQFLALKSSPESHLPFEVIQPTASIDYIKDWQIELRFRVPYMSHGFARPFPTLFSHIDGDGLFMAERILEATGQLAKIRDLRSLKVKFLCICYERAFFGGIMDDLVDQIFRSICSILEPLDCLRFHGSVLFIAAQPDPRSLYASSSRFSDEQCQQPACLAFVAHFRALETSLKSPSSRSQLPVQQRKWLKIKRRVAALGSPMYGYEVHNTLHKLWTLTETYRKTCAEESVKSKEVRRRKFNVLYQTALNELKSATKQERLFGLREWLLKN